MKRFVITRIYQRCTTAAPEFAGTLAGYYGARISGYRQAYQVFKSREQTALDEETGKQTVGADYNKNYPITVMENKWILKQYMNFLENQNITPVFVIMPVTLYYSRYCPDEVIRKFYSNLYEVAGRNHQILDYFRSSGYPDSSWYHVNHLNEIGAQRFVKKMQADIRWEERLERIDDKTKENSAFYSHTE